MANYKSMTKRRTSSREKRPSYLHDSLNRLKSLLRISLLEKKRANEKEDIGFITNLPLSTPFRTSEIVGELSGRLSLLDQESDSQSKASVSNDEFNYQFQEGIQSRDLDEYQTVAEWLGGQKDKPASSSPKEAIPTTFSTLDNQRSVLPSAPSSHLPSPDEGFGALGTPDWQRAEEQPQAHVQLDQVHQGTSYKPFNPLDDRCNPEGYLECHVLNHSRSGGRPPSKRTSVSNLSFSIGDVDIIFEQAEKAPKVTSCPLVCNSELEDSAGMHSSHQKSHENQHADVQHGKMVYIGQDKMWPPPPVVSTGSILSKEMTQGSDVLLDQSSNSPRFKTALEAMVHSHLRQRSDSSSLLEISPDANNLAGDPALQPASLALETQISTADTYSRIQPVVYQASMRLHSSQQLLPGCDFDVDFSKEPRDCNSLDRFGRSHTKTVVTLARGISRDSREMSDRSDAYFCAKAQTRSHARPTFLPHGKYPHSPMSGSQRFKDVELAYRARTSSPIPENDAITIGPEPSANQSSYLTSRYDRSPNRYYEKRSVSRCKPPVMPKEYVPEVSPAYTMYLKPPHSIDPSLSSCFFKRAEALESKSNKDLSTGEPAPAAYVTGAISRELGRACCTPIRGDLRHNAERTRAPLEVRDKGYPRAETKYAEMYLDASVNFRSCSSDAILSLPLSTRKSKTRKV